MKITCHSCQAKYTVSDDKVQGKTVKMKCRKCGATIVVGGAGASAGAGDAAAAQEVEGAGGDLAPGSYLVNVADGDQRTMTLAEVLDAYNTSVINADTYVWSDGMADWQPLGENPTITGALHDAAGGTNGTQPSAPSPAAPAVSESARPAARKEPARRNDLFGGGGFSDGGGGLSSSVSASPAGKRDENSVLFSLSALTSASAPAAKSSSTTATKEDSGLIDLRALAATATPSPAHAPSPVAESAALFPLGAPMLAPPPMSHPMQGPGSMMAPPQAKSMTVPLVIGGLVAIIAIGGVFILLRGSPPPPQTTTPTAQVAETPTAAPTPTPTQSVAAAATDTASAAPPTSASAIATGPKGPIGKPGPRPPGPVSKPGPDTSKPPDVKKPPVSGKGTCGCAPGDLMCAMKCSAK